jgi:electron transfer flavoprotein beta subunit
MRILVCVKQVLVLDEIALSEDGCDAAPGTYHGELNEWDGFAIEEALRLREAHAGEVVAVTYGASAADAVLRRALAMGVDRALRVEGAPADPFTVGKGLGSVASRLDPDLILCGSQASDSAHAATGSVLAAVLDLPCVAAVESIRAQPHKGLIDVSRELESRVIEWLRVSLPAVLTVQTGINAPRHPNLRAIKQAEHSAIEVVHSSKTASAYRVRKMFRPESTAQCQHLGPNPREAAEAIARLIRDHA